MRESFAVLQDFCGFLLTVRYWPKADTRHRHIRPNAGLRYVALLPCGNGRILTGEE